MAWTVALAGSGETTQENAVALLDDWLPVEDVTLVFPKLTRRDTLMRGLVKWAEEENIEVQQDVDLIAELQNIKEGDESYLVLAWDDSEASSKLLEAALEAKIPVKDLTRALDDLEFDDDEAESASTPVSDDPPWDTSAEDASGTVQSHGHGSDSVAEAPVQAEVVGAATLAPQVGLASPPGAFAPSNIMQELDRFIRVVIDEQLRALGLYPEEKKSVHALVNEDGEYRKASKGRPRKGETAIQMTPTEAREKGLDHLLEDE